MTPSRREALMLGTAGLAAAAAGFLLGPLLLQSITGREAGEGGAAANTALRSAKLLDLSGQPRQLGEWLDRVLVCNFWATWCAPCREEIPMLVATRTKYAVAGVEIVGIAIDNAAKVREFAASFSISYPILLAEANGLELMRKLGNSAGGLPYTVIANRQGSVVHRRLGAFQQRELDGILEPLIRA